VAFDKSPADYGAFCSVLVDEQGQPVIPSILSAIQTNSNLAPILQWRGLKSLTEPSYAGTSTRDGIGSTSQLASRGNGHS